MWLILSKKDIQTRIALELFKDRVWSRLCTNSVRSRLASACSV